jgi:hypothetical protein
MIYSVLDGLCDFCDEKFLELYAGTRHIIKIPRLVGEYGHYIEPSG